MHTKWIYIVVKESKRGNKSIVYVYADPVLALNFVKKAKLADPSHFYYVDDREVQG